MLFTFRPIWNEIFIFRLIWVLTATTLSFYPNSFVLLVTHMWIGVFSWYYLNLNMVCFCFVLYCLLCGCVAFVFILIENLFYFHCRVSVVFSIAFCFVQQQILWLLCKGSDKRTIADVTSCPSPLPYHMFCVQDDNELNWSNLKCKKLQVYKEAIREVVMTTKHLPSKHIKSWSHLALFFPFSTFFSFFFSAAVPKRFLGRPKSEFGGHPATRDAKIVLKKSGLWVTFGSKLLSSTSMSEIYSFLK